MTTPSRPPGAYSYDEFRARVAQLLGEDEPNTDSVIARMMTLALSIDDCKPLQNIPRTHPEEEIAAIVATATQLRVDTVQFVCPEELPDAMTLWPSHGSLWSMRAMTGILLALQHASSARLDALHELVEGFIGDRAMSGLHRNFAATPAGVRQALGLSFGWTAGNAVMNHLLLRMSGNIKAAAHVEPLTLLMVSVPFMARHPLRPNKLLVLVRKD